MSLLPHLLRKHAPTLRKTASYYVMHVVVAASVAYAVTGAWWVSLLLSLLEPSVQAVAYFVHEQAWARSGLQRLRTLVKTLTYYGVHLTVASMVAYAITGDLMTALTLSLLEPTVQMCFFYVHERLWQRHAERRAQADELAAPKELVLADVPARPWIPVVCAAPTGCPHRSACVHACAL